MIESLDQLAEAVVRDGLGSAGHSEHTYCFVHRLGLPYCSMTLEAVGIAIGVTRERARQIENDVRSRRAAAGPFYDGGLLDRAIDVLTELAFYDEVAPALIAAGFTKDLFWDVAALVRLAEIMNASDQLLRLKEVADRMATNASSVVRMREQIKALRDQNGLINKAVLLTKVPEAAHLGVKAYEQLREDLNFAESGDTVFAPRSEHPSLRNAFKEQLILAPGFELPSEVVVEGARRRQKGRGKGLSGVAHDVAACVAKLFPEFEFDEANSVVRLIGLNEPELDSDTIAGSIVKYVYSQEGHSAHVYDVMAEMVDNGQNVTSINSYLSYNPLIRTVDNIVFTVGTTPSNHLIEKLNRRADLVYRTGRPYIELDSSSLRGTLQLNPVWIRSGYWYIPNDLNHMFGLTLTVQCGLCANSPELLRVDRENLVGRFHIDAKFTNHLGMNHRVGAMRAIPVRLVRDTLIVG